MKHEAWMKIKNQTPDFIDVTFRHPCLVFAVHIASDTVHDDGSPHVAPEVDGDPSPDQGLGLLVDHEVAGPAEPHHHVLPPDLHLFRRELRLGQVLLRDPLQPLRLLNQGGAVVEPEAEPVMFRIL